MKINSDFISDVKSKLDIVDVIGAYINLQKAGINYKGICPFHNDSHPSMMVNKARQTYHCFVCGEHGDVLDFLQKYNQITFNEALRIACKLADVEFPEQESTPEENVATIHPCCLYRASNASTDFTLPFRASESSSKVNIRSLYNILNSSVIVSNFAQRYEI